VGDVTKKYEHKVSYGINYKILDGYGATAGLPYGKLPAEEIEVEPVWYQPIQAFIIRMDEESRMVKAPYWAYKDPRATVLANLWQGYFDVFLGSFRRPGEVVASYLSKQWITGQDKDKIGLSYWTRFNSSLVNLMTSHADKKETYLFDYNGDVPAQLEILTRRLNLTVTRNAHKLYAPESNHHAEAADVGDSDAQNIYATLRCLCNLR